MKKFMNHILQYFRLNLSQFRLFIVFLVMFLLIGMSQGMANADSKRGANGLKGLIEELLMNNSELKSLTHQINAASSRVHQKAYPKDPKIGVKAMNIPTGNASLSRTPMSGVEIYFMQQLPFPSKLVTKKRMAKAKFNQVQQVHLERMNQLVSKFKTVYFEYAYTTEALYIHERNKRRLTSLATILEARYSTGKVPQQDVLKTKLEIQNIKSEIIKLTELRKIHLARLNTLLNRPKDRHIKYIRPHKAYSKVRYSEEELLDLALNTRPWLKRSDFKIVEAKKAYSLAKQGFIPDFDFQASYRFRNDQITGPLGGENFVSGGVGINVPFLWTLPKHSKKISEKKSLLKSEKKLKENLEQEVIYEVKSAYFNIKESQKQISLYRNHFLPQALSTVDSSMTSYEAGDVDYMSLITSQLSLFKYELDYVRHRFNHEKYVTQLERAIGKPL